MMQVIESAQIPDLIQDGDTIAVGGFGAHCCPDELFYPAYHVDWAFIRATYADEDGNLSFDREALTGLELEMALAAHNCGGHVIAQVEQVMRRGSLDPKRVRIHHKFVDKVEQVTFSAQYARETGQQVLFVTERAVFTLSDTGLKLIEIAPGVRLQEDILDKMSFVPEVAADLKEMDPRIFSAEVMRSA